MRLLHAMAVMVFAVSTASSANYTIEPTTPTRTRPVVIDGAVTTPVARAIPRVPFITLATPPLLAPAIECNTFDTSASYTGGALFIPPAAHCAVGPTHVVTVSNVIVQWRPKVGTTNTPEYENTLTGFFGAVPGVLADNFGFDPKVIFDQHEGRFVIVFLQQWDPAAGDPSEASRILIAISKTSDPNAGWWMHTIDSKLSIETVDRWMDYPGLAVDEHALYLTGNMFAFVSGGNAYAGSRLWIVDKSGAYAGSPVAFTVHDAYAATSGSGSMPATTQPAHMFGASPLDAGARPIGTYLVSYSGLSNAGIEAVQIIEVSDPLGANGGPFFTHQNVSVGDIDETALAMLDAPQLGSNDHIETNDRRALGAVWRNDNLYLCAQVRIPPSDPEEHQTSAHWWRVSTTSPAPGLSLADQGRVGAEDLGVMTYTYYPALMVDVDGNMAISVSASSSSMYPGAYYATRMAGDAPGSIGEAAPLAPGVDFYDRRFGGARNRWGDYSGIALDPDDDATFYVYNQYAGARGSVIPAFPTEDGRWHTKLGWFRVKPSLAVAIVSFDAIVKGDAVSIAGVFRSDLLVERVELYRGVGTGELARIAVDRAASDRFAFTDRDVVPGASYRYQLAVTDGDGEFRSPIVTVEVPAASSVLAQNTPNPFNPTTRIRFQLAKSEHATLSVHDASGHLVRVLVDEARGTGAHDVVWDGKSDAGTPVGSGVYFYRLTAGKFSDAKKMVLLK